MAAGTPPDVCSVGEGGKEMKGKENNVRSISYNCVLLILLPAFQLPALNLLQAKSSKSKLIVLKRIKKKQEEK